MAPKDQKLILVDTSVWIDHLPRADVLSADLLERSDVVMHAFVVGEIACGSLADRALILDLLHQLSAATVAEPDEARGYIERHKLYGKGLGYVDVHLLASAPIGGTKLWTRDTSRAACSVRRTTLRNVYCPR